MSLCVCVSLVLVISKFKMSVTKNDLSSDCTNEFSKAKFVFVVNEGEKASEQRYELARELCRKLKRLGVRDAIESSAMKTRECTHFVCESEQDFVSLWEDEYEREQFFFGDDGREKKQRKNEPFVVTSEYVEACIERGELLDVEESVLYKPPKDKGKKVFNNRFKIALTNYHGERRKHVVKLIETLGAEYSKAFDKSCTHLVAYQHEGAKWEKAVHDGIAKVVSHVWLEDCYASWMKQYESRYTRSGEEEDKEKESRDIVPDSEPEEEEDDDDDDDDDTESEIEKEDSIEAEDVINLQKATTSAFKALRERSNTPSAQYNNGSAKNVSTERTDAEFGIVTHKVSETQQESNDKHQPQFESILQKSTKKTTRLSDSKEKQMLTQPSEERAPLQKPPLLYPSPDYNSLPIEMVERCVRNFIDPTDALTHSKSTSEFQGILGDADDVENALKKGKSFALVDYFPRFFDEDKPSCKINDGDEFLELLKEGKTSKNTGDMGDVERVKYGHYKEFGLLKSLEADERDEMLAETFDEDVQVFDISNEVFCSKEDKKMGFWTGICFSKKTLQRNDFFEVRKYAIACIDACLTYRRKGPLGRAITSHLALERAKNGTTFDDKDDPNALLSTLKNIYLRYGYNFNADDVNKYFLRESVDKTGEYQEFTDNVEAVITLPERNPGNLPGVVLQPVKRTVREVVAGFMEMLVGPSHPVMTQRVPTQPSMRKSKKASSQSPDEFKNPRSPEDFHELATQLATQPPLATQTWGSPTLEEFEKPENVCEIERMHALEDEENVEEEEERPKSKQFHVSGSLERSKSASKEINNRGRYTTELKDTPQEDENDEKVEKKEEEELPVLEPLPTRMTRKRGPSRISAPSPEIQKKIIRENIAPPRSSGLSKNPEHVTEEDYVEISGYKNLMTKKKTDAKERSAVGVAVKKVPALELKAKRKATVEKSFAPSAVKKANNNNNNDNNISNKKNKSNAVTSSSSSKDKTMRVALSGFTAEELKKNTALLKKLNIPYSSAHEWDETVTHVVFGPKGTRSLKFLAAVASGAYVLNATYLENCESNRGKDLPVVEDKHFFNGGRGLENKLICATAAKFWYNWHVSASKLDVRGGDLLSVTAATTTKVLKPFSNLDVAVASFGSNTNAKNEYQMICDVLRAGGANVKTLSANGDAILSKLPLVISKDGNNDTTLGLEESDVREDVVDVIVCAGDVVESVRVTKAMELYEDALVVTSEYIKRFLSCPGEDLEQHTLFETSANINVQDALTKRRLGGPNNVSLGAAQKKRKMISSAATKKTAAPKTQTVNPVVNDNTSDKKRQKNTPAVRPLELTELIPKKTPASSKIFNKTPKAIAPKAFAVEQNTRSTGRGGKGGRANALKSINS